jgi:hypothetical protein
MSPRFRFFALALAAGLVAVTACGDDSNTPVLVPAADAGGGDESEEEEAPCAADYPVYHDGMTVQAGALTVRLLSVAPAPPRQQTPNNWMLEVVDAAGTPASGFTIGNPDSYMPVHRHHGNQPPKVVVQSEPGRVQLAAIDFKMRGPWQVNFDVVPNGEKPIATTIQICVQ